MGVAFPLTQSAALVQEGFSSVRKRGHTMRTARKRTPLEQAELANFAKRLTEGMAKAGMSQSDLARTIWGSTTDTRGQDVARNRDRISHYVRGSQLPEPRTMKAIAQALGCEVADLNPVGGTPAGTESRPLDLSLTMIGGRPDLALLTLNKVMPLTLAVQILALVSKSEAEAEAKKKGGDD